MGWTAYYDRNQGRACAPLLLQALQLAPAQGRRQAIDLGCGGGEDSLALLCQGWHVHAVDSEPQALQRVRALAAAVDAAAQTVPAAGSSEEGEGLQARLSTATVRFEDLMALTAADLIYAGFALPFCHPARFAQFCSVVVDALRPGGVVAGQLFGVNDAWAAEPSMGFMARDQALALFQGLRLHVFEETDAVGPSMGGPKHWHRFDCVAVKA